MSQGPQPLARRGLIAAILVAAILLCGCGGVWAAVSLLDGGDDEAPQVSCARRAGDTYGYCDRLTEVARGRTALSAEQWAAASAVERSVRTVVGERTDAKDIARALRDAGYPTAVVRPARGVDPAPAGSVVYAVPVGPACVIGYRDGEAGGSIPAGTLPGGSCLLP